MNAKIPAAVAILALPLAPAGTPATPAAEFEVQAGTHDLPDLVERAAQFLGRNIMWSASEQQGSSGGLQVTITEAMTLGPTGCEDVISALLHSRGFALLPVNVEHGLYDVINQQGPRRGEITMRSIFQEPAAILARPDLYVPVMTSVRLEHIRAQSAVNTLRPFLHSSGAATALSVGSAGDDATVFVQGFGPSVARVLRMLREADQPQPDTEARATRVDTALEALRARVERLEFKVGIDEDK